MKLEPGKFYVAKNGNVWCCYKVFPRVKSLKKHCQAYCVEIETNRTEYFYLDGRYDKEGEREHCLVDEYYPKGYYQKGIK